MNNLKELKDYLSNTYKTFNELKLIAGNKSKTKKVKAFLITAQLFMMRLEATMKAVDAGGSDPAGGMTVGGIVIQKSIYEDVLNYWIDVLQ